MRGSRAAGGRFSVTVVSGHVDEWSSGVDDVDDEAPPNHCVTRSMLPSSLEQEVAPPLSPPPPPPPPVSGPSSVARESPADRMHQSQQSFSSAPLFTIGPGAAVATTELDATDASEDHISPPAPPRAPSPNPSDSLIPTMPGLKHFVDRVDAAPRWRGIGDAIPLPPPPSESPEGSSNDGDDAGRSISGSDVADRSEDFDTSGPSALLRSRSTARRAPFGTRVERTARMYSDASRGQGNAFVSQLERLLVGDAVEFADAADSGVPRVALSPHTLHTVLASLVQGKTVVTKIDREGAGAKSVRTLRLVDDDALVYEPTRKRDCKRRTRDITRIDQGRAALLRCRIDIETLSNPKEAEALLALTFARGDAVDTWVLLCAGYTQRVLLAQALALHRTLTHPLADRPLEPRIVEAWNLGKPQPDGRMDIAQVLALLPKAGLQVDVSVATRILSNFDYEGDASFEFPDFAAFYEALVLRPELDPVFKGFADEDERITAKGLQRFFIEAQGEQITLSVAQKRLELMARSRGTESLTAADFFSFLLNPTANSWVNPQHNEVYQDMTQPLHHYFIMSSHNSALDGDQLTSRASSEWLGLVLRQGYRAVEIEVFDGPEGSPVVSRYNAAAGARAASCPVAEALEVVRDNAFVASEYPVIIMLEMHASEAQAAIFADIAQWTFGDLLYTRKDAARFEYADLTPQQLRYRILFMLSHHPFTATKYSLNRVSRHQRLKARTKCPVPELVDMSCLMVGDRIDEGAFAEPTDVEVVRCSKLSKLTAAGDERVACMTSNMFIRTFPADEESSNESPVAAMRTGAQLCTMNAQTSDEHLRVYEAYFRNNGCSGYVLKPLVQRLLAKLAPEPPQTVKIVVTVMSALQIQVPDSSWMARIINPFVAVTISGSRDGLTHSRRTQVVIDDTLCPQFNEVFEFEVVGIEVAMMTLRLTHLESSISETYLDLAEAVAPVASIRSGYRVLPLRSCFSNVLLPSSVLVCHFWMSTGRTRAAPEG